MTPIALVGFLFLLLVGLPVGYALLIGGGAAIALDDIPPLAIIQRFYSPSQSFLLLAIPFFILAGELLVGGKLGRRMIDFASQVVGRFTGGLGQASVVTSMFFAGVSGSAVADASGLGSVLIPWQTREGYPGKFAAAVNAASSTLGVIIPPSIPLIVYASVSGVSVGALFLAGIVPGILLATVQLYACRWVAQRNGYPKIDVAIDWKRLGKDAAATLPALALPVLILATIILGIATVTEVSVIAAAYALILRLISRDLTAKELWGVGVRASAATGVVMLLIMASSVLGWILVIENVPERAVEFVLGAGMSVVLVILAMNLIMLLVGTFLDMPAAILVLAPVLLPVAETIGMHPIQFGVVMCVNLAIGLFTPPVGTVLYISSTIAGVKIEKTAGALMPFYGAALVVLLLVSFVPALTIII